MKLQGLTTLLEPFHPEFLDALNCNSPRQSACHVTAHLLIFGNHMGIILINIAITK